MANATKEAPLKTSKEDAFLAQSFDPDKKYMFELAQKNYAREMPVIDVREKRVAPGQDYKPYQNIVFSSQIVWKGQRCNIRYYDGCSSIFVSEQPKDKDMIDQLIRQTKQRAFLNGKFGVYGDEKQMILYLMACSWNVNSPFKTKTATPIFKNANPDQLATVESERIDAMEEALKFAREASVSKMRMHAAYLGIQFTDYDSGNELTDKEIRTAYRKYAAKEPDEFIKTFGNKSIEIKYYIGKALEEGVISNMYNVNKATWGQNNTEICDISGLKSQEAIAAKLYEFSQLEEGEEFLIQLRALYN